MADHILETGRPMPTIGLPGNDAMSIAVSWTHAGSVPGRAGAGLASDRVRERKKGRPAPHGSELPWHARACAV